MRIYRIMDEETDSSVGVLIYYEKEKTFIIELEEGLDEWSAPLLFTAYVKGDIFTMPRDVSFLWVKERIIPSGRQNIGSILSNHKLAAYDEMKLLELSGGKCSQDSLYIKKIDDLPDYVIERQSRNLIDCIISENGYILCFFQNDVVKKVDISKLRDVDGVDKILKNKSLYLSGELGAGGYYITFNDSYDIPAKKLYDNGENVDVSFRDFLTFVERNVLDTTESTRELECSRQNISYMIKQGVLSPIKEEVKGTLFLKSDILKSKW